MLTCIAIDDEPLSLDVLREYTRFMPGITLAKTFTSARKAKEYLAEFPVDLIFLDIEMPDVNGMAFYKSLKQRPYVVFITAYGNYAVEGFAVDAIDYLLKPIDPDRLQEAVCRAISRRMSLPPDSNKSCINVRVNYQLKKISLTDIIYIEGLNDYVKFYVETDSSPVVTLMSMKDVVSKLTENKFIRIHRSYIVPLDKITSYNTRSIQLGEIILPIGDTYRDNIKRLMNDR